jgi:uncharacterized membrane protein
MADRERYTFIDYMRGLVVIMMAFGHSSYFFHSMWNSLDYTDPFFDNISQFLMRYQGYLCAPGFLILAGAMVWLSFHRRISHGATPSSVRKHLLTRGLFLLVVQAIWVNQSWSAFERFRLFHMGIIGCIGISVILLSLMVQTRWVVRLGIGIGLSVVQAFLIRIPYDKTDLLQRALMQTWIDAGSFNVYPVLPWFALAALGSVMAEGWFSRWETQKQKALYTTIIGVASIGFGTALRLLNGFGNTFSYDAFGTFSFFLIQKYPPNVVHNFWVFGGICLWSGFFIALGSRLKTALSPLRVYGSAPLFFYMIHILVLAIFAKRLNLYYREGGGLAVILGFIALLVVMYPLCKGFGKLKATTKNPVIKMI